MDYIVVCLVSHVSFLQNLIIRPTATLHSPFDCSRPHIGAELTQLNEKNDFIF